jgi:hypothetical protein
MRVRAAGRGSGGPPVELAKLAIFCLAWGRFFWTFWHDPPPHPPLSVYEEAAHQLCPSRIKKFILLGLQTFTSSMLVSGSLIDRTCRVETLPGLI